MTIAEGRIREFQQILEEEYGKEISIGEATVLAQRLLLLYQQVYEQRVAQLRQHPWSDRTEP